MRQRCVGCKAVAATIHPFLRIIERKRRSDRSDSGARSSVTLNEEKGAALIKSLDIDSGCR